MAALYIINNPTERTFRLELVGENGRKIGRKISHQRVSLESAVKMCQRRRFDFFYASKYTSFSFHRNHIKLFAVYMKTANLMQNFNVLKRSL